MVEYETFEDWFHEPEGFILRFERFFDQLDHIQYNKDRAEFTRKWLQAAFDAGRCEKVIL